MTLAYKDFLRDPYPAKKSTHCHLRKLPLSLRLNILTRNFKNITVLFNDDLKLLWRSPLIN